MSWGCRHGGRRLACSSDAAPRAPPSAAPPAAAESLPPLTNRPPPPLSQGWIDVTYLSPDGRLRLSRGNKVRAACKQRRAVVHGGCQQGTLLCAAPHAPHAPRHPRPHRASRRSPGPCPGHAVCACQGDQRPRPAAGGAGGAAPRRRADCAAGRGAAGARLWGHAGAAVSGAAPAASTLPACCRAPSCATCPPARLPQAEGGSEAAPAASPLAPGTWRLVWTQQGETANPLQRALANQVEVRQAGWVPACETRLRRKERHVAAELSPLCTHACCSPLPRASRS